MVYAVPSLDLVPVVQRHASLSCVRQPGPFAAFQQARGEVEVDHHEQSTLGQQRLDSGQATASCTLRGLHVVRSKAVLGGVADAKNVDRLAIDREQDTVHVPPPSVE